MNPRHSFRALLLAAAATITPSATHAATVTWDGSTTSYALASGDVFTYTAGASSASGLTVTGARDFDITGDLTLGGAFSLVQSGGGSLYQGIELAAASSTITATAITLTGDIGKQSSDGNTLTLNTSGSNGNIDLNVSFGRSGVWYIPSSFTANAGTGTITVSGSGPSSSGWRSTSVSLTGGAINVSGNVAADGAITLTNSLASSISGILSGAMSLTKAGAGTMTMTGRATYTGATVVNAGTLQLNDARSMNGSITVNSGATLTLQGNGNGGYFQPSSLTVNNATVNSSIAASNRYHGIYTTAISLSGTSTISTPLFVSKTGIAGETMTITVASGGDASISGTILNHPDTTGGSLTKAGAGTLTLTGIAGGGNSTTLTGNVLVSAGTLKVGGVVNSTNPTVTAIGNMTTVGRTVTVSSGARLEFISADTMGSYSYASPVTIIADGGTIARTAFGSIGNVTLRNGGRLTISNGTGTSFVKSMQLNGTLTVDGTSGSFIDVASGASTNLGLQLLATGGSTVFNVGSTGDATADLTVTAPLTDSVNAAVTGLSANTLVKAGAGKMVLDYANSYSGGTTLRAGTLVAKNASSFGTTGTVTVNDASTGTSNTTLLIDATSGGITVARAITVANQGTGTVTLGSATASGSGQAIFSGAITLNKAATLTGGTAGDRMGFTGGIGGTANVTIAGTSRVLFSGTANTYAGTTTINSGAILQLSDGTSTANSFLADASDVTVTGTLRLAKGGNSETIAGLNGAGTVSAISGSDTLIVGSGNANGSFSGALNNGGATLALTKTGTGTQTLTGTSNYTGATTVSNGTLALGTGGALGNTAVTIASGATFSTASGTTAGGAVTVNSGGTLTANGTISGAVSLASNGTLRGTGSAGAVTVADGTANLVAGNGTSGTLTLSSLTFDGTGTLALGSLANYTSSAAFVVTNALALNGGAVTLSLPAGVISNGTYKLISYGSTAATTASFSVVGPVIGARQTGGLEQDTVGKVFQYVVAGDSPRWTGANGSAFSGGGNWQLINAGTSTDFLANDSLLLDDTASSYTVDISGGNVAPAAVSFDNSSANYVLQGDSGLSSGTLSKSGTGDLRINNANSATSVSISAGSVTLGAAGALGTSTVTLSGGTLDLNGQTTAAAIALSGGSIAGNGTVTGAISGSGALAKSSAGTLTLSAQNTFTGGTTVSDGTLVLGDATNTLADAGAVTVSGGVLSLGSNSDTVGAVTLTGGSITGSGTLTGASYAVSAGAVTAKLGGAGALTKSGAGTTTLSAANTYSGGTTLADGTLAIGDNAALGTGSVALNGGTLALSGQSLSNAITLGGGAISGSGTISGSLSGASAFIKSGTGALVLSGAQNPSGGISVTGGTLEVSGSLNGGAYAGAIASNGSGALSLTGNANQTLSGVISGSAGLTKSGTGILTLTAANTFAGNLTINDGEVRLNATPVGNATAAGDMSVAGRVITVGSGATLKAIIGDLFAAYNVKPTASILLDGGTYWRQGKEVNTLNYFNSLGDITLRNGATIRTGSGHVQDVQSLAFNGTVTVDGSTGSSITATAGTSLNGIHLGTVGGATTFAVSDTGSTDDLTVGVQLADKVLSGAAGLAKTGAGRMVLAASNVYSGSTTISGGTLAITSGGGIYRGAYRVANISIASGATLELETWHYNETASSLGGLAALASGITVNGGTIRVTGTTTSGRGFTVNSGGATLEAASGATWNLDNAGDGNNALVYNGNPSLTLTGAGTGNLNKAFSGSGSLTKSGSGTWTLSAASTHTGGTAVSNGTLRLGASGALGSGSVTLSGGSLDLNGQTVTNAIALSGGSLAGSGTANGVLSGAGSVSKSTAGTLTLGGANTYSGGTSVSNGTLRVGADGALGSGAVALSGGVLDVDGRTLANAITLSGGSLSGAATLSGVLSGTGGLAKSSAGVLSLSAANTYTGATDVTNGTLALLSGGSLAADSAVTVGSGATLRVDAGAAAAGTVTLQSGATLRGSGSLGAVTVEDGFSTLVSGTSGTMTLDSLAFGGAATLSFGALSGYELAPAFAVTGALTGSAGAGLIGLSLPTGIVANGTYQLITFASTDLDVASFNLTGPVLGGRQAAELQNTGSAFVYVVSGTSPKWTGANGTAFSGGGNWTIIGGDGSPDDYIANDVLLVDDTATGTVLDISGADVAPTAINFENAAKDFTLQGSNGASGTLAKSGAGSVTLSNANSFASVTLSSGRLVLDNDGALGTATVALSGGVLDLGGSSTDAAISLEGGAIEGSGTVAGVISGSLGLTKSAPGTLTLAATNTYTGGTTVSDGVLALGNATDTLADGEAVTVTGGELALGSNSDTVGAVTLSGGSITGSGTLTGSSYALQSGSVSAILGGSAAVTKSGAGTVTLSGANTFSGGTTVSNGVLALGDDNALGTGSVSLAGGSVELSGQTLSNAIAFSGGSVAGNGTLSGALSGSSALTKSGNGTVTISADNALGSGINVTGGTLAVSGTLGGGTYAAGIATSGTIAFTSASNQTLSSVVSGSGSLAKSGDGTLTLSGGASTFTGDVNITGGKVIVSTASAAAQGTNPTSSGLGNIASGTARTITVDGSTSILEFATPDAIGAFGYNNSNIMLVARNGGVITRTSGAFNSIGSITLEEGGILRGNDGQNGTVNSMSINGSVTVTGTTAGGTIESVGTSNAGIHLRSVGSSGNVTFTVADTAADVDLLVSASLVNPIQINYFGYNANGTGAGITKEGLGKMSLTAANGFSRGVTINAGVVSAGHANALGSGAVTLNGGALDVADVALANNITAAGGSITGSGTLSGVISGSGALSVSSSGSLLLTGTNTFSGGLTLNAGSLSGNAAAAFGTGAITVNGGSLDLGGYTLGSDITLTGGALAGTSGLTGSIVFSNLTLTFADLTTFGSAAITVGEGATLDFADFNPTNAITLNGGTLLNYSNWNKPVTLAGNVDAELINNLAANEVTVTTGSTVDLTGVSKDIVFAGGTLNNLSSYTGTLTIQSSLDLTNNIPSGDATIRVGNGGTVDFGGNNFAGAVEYTGGTVANYSGDVTVVGAGVALNAGSLGSANVVVATGATVSFGSGFSNDISLAGGGIVGDSLNNYTGTLRVTSGTLDLDGADSDLVITSTANIVVADGATLKGSASVGSVTLESGAILAPGNSPGLLNFANLTLAVDPIYGTTGSMDMEIAGLFAGDGSAPVAGTDFDSIAITGLLDLTQLSPASRFTLNLLSLSEDGVTPGAPRGWDPSTDFALALFGYGALDLGGNSDVSALFAINTTGFLDGNGQQVSVSHFSVINDAASQQIRLVYSAVPEPSTYGLMLGGLALAAAAYRRRKSKTA